MGRTVSSDPTVIPLLASPTGYNAGDYVYETNAGFGSIPAAALPTGNFLAGSTSYLASAQAATTANELTYVEQLGGSMGSQVAAQLTNGNIVYVYATGTTSSTVNFKIETSAGVPVVAETSTTMTVPGMPGQVSVVALPAGGFCIVCTTAASDFNLAARFYNADGTPATAVLASATLNLTNTAVVARFKLQARSDGSVIVGYLNGSGVSFQLRRVTTAGFDATFGTSGVSAIGVFNNNSKSWDFLVDASNDIHVIFRTSATDVTMRRYSAAGIQQTTSTVITTNIRAVAIARSSDNVIRGFLQRSTGVFIVTWDGATAALGAQIITIAVDVVGGAMEAFAQGASGGYVVLYSDFISGTVTSCLFFQAFDSSNTPLAAATRANGLVTATYRMQFTPIVVSSNTRVYFGVFQLNETTTGTYATPMGVAYFAYNNTTFALVGAPSATAPSFLVGPFALGSYNRQTSTPNTASFSVSSTGNYTTNYTAGTLLIQKTLVDGAFASSRVVLAPLPNGEFVVAWVRNSGALTRISRYSSEGVLIAGPVTVATGGGAESCGVAVFANGNILVTHAVSSTLSFTILTPALAVVTSGTISAGSYTPDSSVPVAVASFGIGNHIAVGFRNTTTVNYSTVVVRDNGTVTSIVSLTLTVRPVFGQIVPFKSSGFAVIATDNGTDNTCLMQACIVRQTGTTTFSAGTPSTYTAVFSPANFVAGSTPTPSSGNVAYVISATGASGAYQYSLGTINPRFNVNTQFPTGSFSGTPFSNTVDSNSGLTIGYTASGMPVAVSNARTGSQFIAVQPINSNNTGGSFSANGSFTTTLATQGSTRGPSVISHVGEAVLISYSDSDNYPAFVSVAAAPFSVSTALTAGVSVSTSTLTLTPNSGYTMRGVSLTSAASGSAGLVQTSGVATLSSSYSAVTPATTYDFTNPITNGVRGVVVGRSVSIQG